MIADGDLLNMTRCISLLLQSWFQGRAYLLVNLDTRLCPDVECGEVPAMVAI
jgi:hypothetical protein